MSTTDRPAFTAYDHRECARLAREYLGHRVLVLRQAAGFRADAAAFRAQGDERNAGLYDHLGERYDRVAAILAAPLADQPQPAPRVRRLDHDGNLSAVTP